jgi:DNA repair exonuclease SbcCD ATPase subunit
LDLEIGRVSGEIHDVEQELQAQQVEAAGLRDKIEEYRRNCRLLEASLWRLSKGVCPTCEQGIPNVAVSALRESLDKLVNDNGAEISDDDERLGILQRSIKALRDQQTRLWGDLNSLKQSRVRALEQQSQAARVAESLAEADSRIAGFDSDVLKLKEQRGAAHAEFKELEACERALGYRGIRANLLGRALGGLQSVCNVWLKRISGRTWVDIKPYTERKSGSVSECIALRVNGAGGGQGYAGSSGGERRRIDVALILALGEFAASSNGLRGGTIFCDEVFDAIDSEGVEPVAEAISSISEERLAIVISHNPAVLGLLKGPHIRIGG